MAYLNVRERRVETTIAYVGPIGSGKATNLEQLGHRSRVAREAVRGHEHGEALVLDWTATEQEHFRDCSVSVKLVGQKGPSPEHVRKLVREADGIVLVLGAEPAAAPENRRFAELVREAVATSEKPNLPVLVQVNKADLPDALTAEDVAKALGFDWPHLSATAVSGEGVVATLERIVERVLVALRDVPEEPAGVAPSTNASRTEGNPLLGALKQVLRETVRAHVAELGELFAEKLARSTASTKEQHEKSTAELAALRLALVDESARTRASLTTVRDEMEALRQSTHELRLRVATGTEETVRALVSMSASLATYGEHLAELERLAPDPEVLAGLSRQVTALSDMVAAHGARLEELGRPREDERALEAITELSSRTDSLVATLSSQGATLALLESRMRDTGPWDRLDSRVDQLATSISSLEKKAVAPLGGELAKMRAEARKGMDDLATHIPRASEELRADLLRALEVRSRTDRDHTTASVNALRASLTLLSDAVDRADGSERLAAILSGLDELRADKGWRAVEEAVQTSARKADAHAATSLSADARADVSFEDIRARLSELQSELKKKKSWFT